MSGSTLLAVAGIGAIVGFLGGMFGKGGAAIATPLLRVAGIPAFYAVASPLPSTIPATLVAWSAYRRTGLTNWRVVRTMLAFGLPATALGAYATRIVGGSAIVLACEAAVALVGLRVLLHPHEPVEVAWSSDPSTLRMAVVAITVGGLSGLLANGGGFLLVPLFVMALRLPMKEALASSLITAAAFAIPGTAVHAALGHVDWMVVAVFGAAAIPLSYTGARVALRVHAQRLERLYGGMLVALGAVTFALTA